MMENLAHGDGNSRMNLSGSNETVTLRDDTRKRSVLGDANGNYGVIITRSRPSWEKSGEK